MFTVLLYQGLRQIKDANNIYQAIAVFIGLTSGL